MTPGSIARVLVVARSTPLHAVAGGMESSAEELVSAFQSLGIETALLTTELDGARTYPEGFQNHRALWAIRTDRPGRYSRAWWRATTGRGEWTDWAPNLILGIGDAAGGFTRVRHLEVPIVVQCHGTTDMEIRSAMAAGGARGCAKAVLNWSRTRSRRAHLRGVCQVLAVGPAVAESLVGGRYRIDPEKVRVLPNVVDAEAFRFDEAERLAVRERLAITASQRVWLTIGRLDRDKGVDLAIEATLGDPDAVLLVVGSGREESELRELAGAELERRVRFLGRVPSRDVPSLMSASDVLLFPTRRSEGLPMVVLEAAAAGLPLVTSDRANLPADLSSDDIRNVDPTAVDVVDDIRRAARGWEARLGRKPRLPDVYSSSTYSSRLARALESIGSLT